MSSRELWPPSTSFCYAEEADQRCHANDLAPSLFLTGGELDHHDVDTPGTLQSHTSCLYVRLIAERNRKACPSQFCRHLPCPTRDTSRALLLADSVTVQGARPIYHVQGPQAISQESTIPSCDTLSQHCFPRQWGGNTSRISLSAAPHVYEWLRRVFNDGTRRSECCRACRRPRESGRRLSNLAPPYYVQYILALRSCSSTTPKFPLASWHYGHAHTVAFRCYYHDP